MEMVCRGGVKECNGRHERRRTRGYIFLFFVCQIVFLEEKKRWETRVSSKKGRTHGRRKEMMFVARLPEKKRVKCLAAAAGFAAAAVDLLALGDVDLGLGGGGWLRLPVKK